MSYFGKNKGEKVDLTNGDSIDIKIETEIEEVDPNGLDINFYNNKRWVGRLYFTKSKMSFEGKLNESAKIFFNYLQDMIDDYIKDELK